MKKSKKELIVVTSPLQLLKDGILQQDWSLVEQGYSLLTGETLSDHETKPAAKPSGKRGRPKKVVVEDDDEDNDNNEKLVSIPKSGVTKITGDPALAPLGQLRKPALPFANSHDPVAKKQALAIAKRSKKLNIEKDYRQPYRQIMQKCSGCNKEFELAKEYPLGRVNDKDRANIYYCNRCKGGGR